VRQGGLKKDTGVQGGGGKGAFGTGRVYNPYCRAEVEEIEGGIWGAVDLQRF